MPHLLKTEPDVYSFSDLQRDGETLWDGVNNPQAVKYLREMQPGEQLVIYHTGEERAAVGTAEVLSVDATDSKMPRVRIRCGAPVAAKRLSEVKQQALFADSPLVRQARLSVVPLTAAQYKWFIKG